MKPKFTFLCAVLLMYISQSNAQTFSFLIELGSYSGDNEDIIPDKFGNFYIGGGFQGTINLGGIDHTAVGSYDCFIAKYDAAGNFLWAYTFGDTEYDELTGMTLDKKGILISGTYQGTIDINGNILTSAGYKDAFMVDFDANGNVKFINTIASISGDEGNDVAIDRDGNKYLCGEVGDAIAFNGEEFSVDGGSNGYVAKYDTDGNPIWIKFVTSTWYCRFKEMEIDKIGNIILSGEFNYDMTADGITYTAENYSQFMMCISGLLPVLWVNNFENGPVDYITDLAIDKAGNAYVTMSLYNEITIDGVTYVKSIDEFDAEGLVAKFNRATGTAAWVKQMTGGLRASPTQINVTAAGTIVVSGNYRGTIHFNGSEISTGSDADVESFILETDRKGHVLDLYDFGNDATNDAIEGLNFDGDGNMLLFGFSFGTAVMGDYTIIGSPERWITKMIPGGRYSAEPALENYSIEIYPNPASEFVTVDLTGSDSETVILIVNESGEIVYQTVSDEKVITIDVTQFASGIYFIKTENASASFVVNK